MFKEMGEWRIFETAEQPNGCAPLRARSPKASEIN